jgi:hypothetical protein
MSRVRIFFGGFGALALLAMSASGAYGAGRGSATAQGYPSATAPPAAGVASGTAGGSHTSGGTLPFTGMQLTLVVLVGLLLLAVGIILRRSGRNQSSV